MRRATLGDAVGLNNTFWSYRAPQNTLTMWTKTMRPSLSSGMGTHNRLYVKTNHKLISKATKVQIWGLTNKHSKENCEVFPFQDTSLRWWRLSVSKLADLRYGVPNCASRRMVTGDKGHDVLPRFGPSWWRWNPTSCLIDIDNVGITRVDLPRDQGG